MSGNRLRSRLKAAMRRNFSEVHSNREIACFVTALPCESEVPFGMRALASQCGPWSLLHALAGQCVRLSSKRNGGGGSVISGVDDYGVAVSAVMTANAFFVSVLVADGAVIRWCRDCR